MAERLEDPAISVTCSVSPLWTWIIHDECGVGVIEVLLGIASQLAAKSFAGIHVSSKVCMKTVSYVTSMMPAETRLRRFALQTEMSSPTPPLL
jgi:hypothetical protein